MNDRAFVQVWKISADDGDDLMDEDSLLNEEELKPVPKGADDCELAEGRKACKNCSCGRAEAEALAEAGGQPSAAPTSACGSVSSAPYCHCCGLLRKKFCRAGCQIVGHCA